LALRSLVVGVRSDPRTNVIPLHGLILFLRLPLRAWTDRVFELFVITRTMQIRYRLRGKAYRLKTFESGLQRFV
jgi:hypothetical protein